MDHKVSRKKLPSGLEMITAAYEGTHLISVGVFIRCGVRNETLEQSGYAVFNDNFFLKGTNKYSEDQIHNILDDTGADADYATGNTYTYITLYGNANDLNIFLDFLREIIFNQKISQKTFDDEKERVLDLYNKSTSDGYSSKFSKMYLLKMFYGTSIANPTYGTLKSLRNITLDKLMEFRNKFFVPSNMVIVAAGMVNPDEFFSKAASFGLEPSNPIESTFNYLENDLIVIKDMVEKQKKPKVVFLTDMNERQVTVKFVFHLADTYIKNQAELSVIAELMGGGSFSRLFILLREKLGTTYSSGAVSKYYINVNTFEIVYSVDPNRLHDTIKAIADELIVIRENGVQEKEVELAKKKLITSTLFAYQAPDDFVVYYGIDGVQGTNLTIMDTIDKINKVTVTKINEILKDIFKRRRLNLIVFGNITNDDFEYVEEVL